MSVDDLLCSTGLPLYLITKHNIKIKSYIKIEKNNNPFVEPKICWRFKPYLLAECSFIDDISSLEITDDRSTYKFSLIISSLLFNYELDPNYSIDINIATELHSCLRNYINKSKNLLEKENNRNKNKDNNNISSSLYTSSYETTLTLRKSICDAMIKEEELIQLCFYLRYKEAYLLTEKIYMLFIQKIKFNALKQWIQVTKDLNETKV
jgi:hypothetical protein